MAHLKAYRTNKGTKYIILEQDKTIVIWGIVPRKKQRKPLSKYPRR